MDEYITGIGRKGTFKYIRSFILASDSRKYFFLCTFGVLALSEHLRMFNFIEKYDKKIVLL